MSDRWAVGIHFALKSKPRNFGQIDFFKSPVWRDLQFSRPATDANGRATLPFVIPPEQKDSTLTYETIPFSIFMQAPETDGKSRYAKMLVQNIRSIPFVPSYLKNFDLYVFHGVPGVALLVIELFSIREKAIRSITKVPGSASRLGAKICGVSEGRG